MSAENKVNELCQLHVNSKVWRVLLQIRLR